MAPMHTFRQTSPRSHTRSRAMYDMPPSPTTCAQTALLYYVSTPTLEAGADKKYGGQAAYQEYKRTTPALRFRLS